MEDQKDFITWMLSLFSTYGIDGLTILAIIGITQFVKTATHKKNKLYALLPLILGIGSGLATTKVWTFGNLYQASLKYAGTAMILYLIWDVAFEPFRRWFLSKFLTPAKGRES